MKTHVLLVLAACLALLGSLTSCNSLKQATDKIDSEKVVEFSRTWMDDSAREITRYVLRTQLSGDGKKEYAKVLKAAAVALRAISVGQAAPTEQEFEAALLAVAPDIKYAELWPTVAASLTSLYASVSPHFPENAKVALELVGLLAKGIEQGLTLSGYAYVRPDTPGLWRIHPAAHLFADDGFILEHYQVYPAWASLELS